MCPALTSVGLTHKTFNLSTNYIGGYTGFTWTPCCTSGASEPPIKDSGSYLRTTSILSSQVTGLTGSKKRGEALLLSEVAKDNRYLISEMACKSFEIVEGKGDANQIEQVMSDLFEKHRADGGGPVVARQLLTGTYAKGRYAHLQPQLQLSADDFMEEILEDEDSLLEKIHRVAQDFTRARRAALSNTAMYLSMVGDLDVYIATSMRNRDDFREMSDFLRDSVWQRPIASVEASIL